MAPKDGFSTAGRAGGEKDLFVSSSELKPFQPCEPSSCSNFVSEIFLDG